MENGNQITYRHLHKKSSAGYRPRYLKPNFVFRQLAAQSSYQTLFCLSTSPSCCPHHLLTLWRWALACLLSSGLSLTLYLRERKDSFSPAQTTTSLGGSYPKLHSNEAAHWPKRAQSRAPSPFQPLNCMGKLKAGFGWIFFPLKSNKPLLNYKQKLAAISQTLSRAAKSFLCKAWHGRIRTNDTEGKGWTAGVSISPAETCKEIGSRQWAWQQGFTLPKHVSLLLALCTCRSR